MFHYSLCETNIQILTAEHSQAGLPLQLHTFPTGVMVLKGQGVSQEEERQSMVNYLICAPRLKTKKSDRAPNNYFKGEFG